jgi:hypothetical protein
MFTRKPLAAADMERVIASLSERLLPAGCQDAAGGLATNHT